MACECGSAHTEALVGAARAADLPAKVVSRPAMAGVLRAIGGRTLQLTAHRVVVVG